MGCEAKYPRGGQCRNICMGDRVSGREVRGREYEDVRSKRENVLLIRFSLEDVPNFLFLP